MAKAAVKSKSKSDVVQVRGGKGKVAKSAKKVREEPVKTKKIHKDTLIPDDAAATISKSMLAIYSKRIDAVEKKYALTSSQLIIPNRQSTGTLCMDLIIGGGLVPGTMFQVSGKERGGKSTACMTTLGCAVESMVPVIQYWDAENALNDPIYAEAVIRHKLNTIFYGPERRARLYQENVLEDFYNGTKSLMRTLPDKYYRHEDKTWYFAFNADQEGRSMMSDFGYTKYEKPLYQATGRLWCPTDQVGPQGLVFCDSYPGLSTSDEDDADESSKGLALDARAFAKNIKKVKGVMKRKGFIIYGVNQIRTNPGAKYGDPSYEPGGIALQQYADCRVQVRPRAVPDYMTKGKNEEGQATSEYGMEPSVTGDGSDSYVYTFMKNTKNKTGTPFIGVMARIWYRDCKGKPHGYDPVFDVWNYLKVTGRAKNGTKKMKIDVPELVGKTIEWGQFKLLVLAEYFGSKELTAKSMKQLGLGKPLRLRKRCFAEIRAGLSYDLMNKPAAKEEVEVDLEQDDD